MKCMCHCSLKWELLSKSTLNGENCDNTFKSHMKPKYKFNVSKKYIVTWNQSINLMIKKSKKIIYWKQNGSSISFLYETGLTAKRRRKVLTNLVCLVKEKSNW